MRPTSETPLGTRVRCSQGFVWITRSRSSKSRVLVSADWNTDRVDWIAYSYTDLEIVTPEGK